MNGGEVFSPIGFQTHSFHYGTGKCLQEQKKKWGRTFTIRFPIRMDRDIKRDSEALYSELGGDFHTAVNLFLKTPLCAEEFPFVVRLDVHNADTIATYQEAERIAMDKRGRSTGMLMMCWGSGGRNRTGGLMVLILHLERMKGFPCQLRVMVSSMNPKRAMNKVAVSCHRHHGL